MPINLEGNQIRIGLAYQVVASPEYRRYILGGTNTENAVTLMAGVPGRTTSGLSIVIDIPEYYFEPKRKTVTCFDLGSGTYSISDPNQIYKGSGYGNPYGRSQSNTGIEVAVESFIAADISIEASSRNRERMAIAMAAQSADRITGSITSFHRDLFVVSNTPKPAETYTSWGHVSMTDIIQSVNAVNYQKPGQHDQYLVKLNPPAEKETFSHNLIIGGVDIVDGNAQPFNLGFRPDAANPEVEAKNLLQIIIYRCFAPIDRNLWGRFREPNGRILLLRSNNGYQGNFVFTERPVSEPPVYRPIKQLVIDQDRIARYTLNLVAGEEIVWDREGDNRYVNPDLVTLPTQLVPVLR